MACISDCASASSGDHPLPVQYWYVNGFCQYAGWAMVRTAKRSRGRIRREGARPGRPKPSAVSASGFPVTP